ncbi:unnamed protein product [Vitrella brassicaformis CCMP3155]|uniref:Protein kinase domain-containing protein n=1 Tax=Vitrella brassicaformis (strain CCMP3155) TaxID=1169540 RepID=A0A0G4GAB2_VITBC|nr:unnamed protein product [Vitrella brassicaformis CCMP3155]|eukprot:CEM25889.1 unnamed protein product [Vitrella brassicaformis CCMP3155]
MECQWEQIQTSGDVYLPRSGHAVVLYEDVLYLFGGTDKTARQNDLYAFNIENSLWQLVADDSGPSRPPNARSNCQGIAYEGKLYFFGGFTGKGGEYFNDVHEFDIARCRWAPIKPIGEPPAHRSDHSMVLYGTTAYIFGGFDGSNRLNDVGVLSLAGESKRWLANGSAQNPPENRFGHTAVVYENGMYVFGGWNGQNTLSDLYEYVFGTNEWIKVEPRGSAPKSRYRHSAVIGGTKMFVFGGVDETHTRYADIHVFDCQARTWTQLETHGDVPSGRTWHRAVMHRGYMHILGGFDGDQRQNDMYRIKVLSAEQERIEEQRINLARSKLARSILSPTGAAAKGATTSFSMDDQVLNYIKADELEVSGFGGVLGSGGRGTVFKARWKPKGLSVAAKMLVSAYESSMKEAQKEVLLLSHVLRAKHPRLIKLHGLAEQDGKPIIVTELCTGGPVHKYIERLAKDGRLDDSIRQKLAVQICEGIVALHAHKVIHRDLKPSNILVDAGGSIKITNFGLARILLSTSKSVTHGLGRHGFMAPETYDRNNPISFAADIWALACVLVEILGGKRPFAELGSLSPEAAHTEAMRLHGQGVKPEVPTGKLFPPHVRQIILMCFEKDPNRRPTAQQVLVALTGASRPVTPNPPPTAPQDANTITLPRKPLSPSAPNSPSDGRLSPADILEL